MRRPKDAHYSFTIPSIHDDTTLDCRIYHPDAVLKPKDSSEIEQWKRRGIVMAHPYATMGGSYDDRVVGIVVDEFLHAGWMVGTFNFRGAHTSKGRTSWSGKPELDDYSSFAAFFMHYMSYIQPHLIKAPGNTCTPDYLPISPEIRESAQTQPDTCPVVVLGGYSYGSLILKHLPPVPTILQPFSTPLAGSAADEIVLRARKLAAQSNLDWVNLARDENRAKKSRPSHDLSTPVVIGGEEISPHKRRSSKDARMSIEGGTRLEIKTRLRSLSHRRHHHNEATAPPETKSVSITMPIIRYLLISPLTPPVSTVIAPALGYKFWSKSGEDHHEVIGKHACLAIYGDQDIFSSAKKIRDWSDQLKAAPTSRFTSVEVAGAGHFWVEPDVEVKLRSALEEWEHDIR
ncbi:prolyl oligopeptidase [Pyrenophora seminiperda CCB06]|uniref:Prolyl oligopeptidase n=1 Tax=Pyrenophora seminiperda CCB06 TaxID=1302712 RepID=A0A3M7MCA9_9PLEO|nr:prolyl oligopeptidase [Pyrenophora seminiperda CCB06]